MRTVLGTMLAAGLLLLAGCGGGTRVVTKVVTATSPGGSRAPKSPPPPSPDAIATAQTLVGAGLAADAEQATLPAGDSVFAAAVAAAADTLTLPSRSSHPPHVGPGGAVTTPTTAVSGQGSGEYAVAYTGANFQHPSQITLHVSASPPQKGSIVWNVVCYEDSGGIGRLEGRATLDLPATKNLPLPAPSHTCTVSANVQLAKTGTVSISITA